MKTVFTTGQVAKLCKVAPRTVTKWFDSGRLRGYRIPGSQDRRIPRESLVRFLKEHGMPLGELEEMALGKVLLIDVNSHQQALLGAYLTDDSFQIELATNAFEAGLKARSLNPDCVVLNLSIGCDLGLQIARALQHGPDCLDGVLIGLLSPADNLSDDARGLFGATFQHPVDLARVAENIWTRVKARKPLIG
jgi:excisionase family DNA binding protein